MKTKDVLVDCDRRLLRNMAGMTWRDGGGSNMWIEGADCSNEKKLK